MHDPSDEDARSNARYVTLKRNSRHGNESEGKTAVGEKYKHGD